MKHSEILEKVEGLVSQPLRIYSIDRVNTVTLDKAEDNHACGRMEPGDYAVVELRLMLPLKAG